MERDLPALPDQWVVLVDADWADDHNFEFGSAHVFAHRESRGQATKDMGEACRSFKNVGCFFTGRIRDPFLGSRFREGHALRSGR